MNTFDTFVEKIIIHEGGDLVSDDPDDRGGTTKYGISINFAGSINLDLNDDGRTTKADIIALTLDDAKEIYFEHFWEKIQGYLLPRGLAYIAFDAAVNQGVHAASVDLQRSLGVKDDGIIGHKTRIAAHSQYSTDMVNEYCARRMRRYGLTKRFDRFGLGWARRLFDVHQYGSFLTWTDT